MSAHRILLADDHAVFRAGLRKLIADDSAFEVVGEASSGPEVLSMVERLQPDVLVLDMHMPPMNGAEVVRRLNERGMRPRILVLSAFDDAPYVESMTELGVDGYVTKSRPPAMILLALHEVAEGRTSWLVQASGPHVRLTARERDILGHLARGHSNEEIAAALDISEATVRNTLTVVYQKIDVTNARAAVAWAWANRLVTPSAP